MNKGEDHLAESLRLELMTASARHDTNDTTQPVTTSRIVAVQYTPPHCDAAHSGSIGKGNETKWAPVPGTRSVDLTIQSCPPVQHGEFLVPHVTTGWYNKAEA